MHLAKQLFVPCLHWSVDIESCKILGYVWLRVAVMLLEVIDNGNRLQQLLYILWFTKHLYWSYLALPFGASILPPSTVVSSRPNVHPRVNPKVTEIFGRFLQT